MNDSERFAVEDVETLLAIAREHDLDALTVCDEDWEITIVRREPGVAAAALPPVLPVGTVPNAAVVPPAMPADVLRVTAPIIGVFYRAPAPDAVPYASIGDRVEVGQVLCILEAMKLMNEITSDFAGIITSVTPENGDLVTIGQEMFTIAPHA